MRKTSILHKPVIGFLALYALLVGIMPRTHVFTGRPLLSFQMTTYLGLGILGIYLFRNDFARAFGLWKAKPLTQGTWLIGTFIAALLGQNIAVIPAALLGMDSIGGNAEAITAALDLLPFPFVLAALGMAGPMVEELIYRVVLVGWASSRLPLAICIIVSSLLFGFMHIRTLTVYELAGALPTVAVGALYAIAYVQTRNITIPLALHILNNSFALVAVSSS